MQVDHPAAILGIALVVSLRPVADPFVCRPVDVVDGLLHGRHSSGDEDFLQALWGEGEVRRRAEPTEALAQDAPAIHSHLRTYVLRIPDDGIGSEVTEVFRLSLGSIPGKRADRGGTAGSSLIQQQNPEVFQCAIEPARAARVPGRPRGFVSGPSLEEDQVGPVAAVEGRHLSHENGDQLGVRPAVIEWEGELMFDEVDAAHPVGHGHRRILTRRSTEGMRRSRSLHSEGVVEPLGRATPLIRERRASPAATPVGAGHATPVPASPQYPFGTLCRYCWWYSSA